MAMIYVAGKYFKSKTALKDYIRRDIIDMESGARTGDYKEIDHKHDSFLLDLLKHHRYRSEKLPENKTFSGFRAYYKGTPRPNYPRQWHRASNNLVIAYGDGSLMDFSWCKLIDGFPEYYRTKRAFRDAIEYQCRMHKANVIKTLGRVSELSGEPVTGPGVIHHDQTTFDTLVESFLVTKQISWKSFDQRDEVLPDAVRISWQQYHEVNSHLLFVSEPEHKEIHKGR